MSLYVRIDGSVHMITPSWQLRTRRGTAANRANGERVGRSNGRQGSGGGGGVRFPDRSGVEGAGDGTRAMADGVHAVRRRDVSTPSLLPPSRRSSDELGAKAEGDEWPHNMKIHSLQTLKHRK